MELSFWVRPEIQQGLACPRSPRQMGREREQEYWSSAGKSTGDAAQGSPSGTP